MAVRSTTMRFCSFSTAQVRVVEKDQRQTHGTETSVGGASRFDADARAPSRQVFATKRGAGITSQNTGNELVARRDPTS